MAGAVQHGFLERRQIPEGRVGPFALADICDECGKRESLISPEGGDGQFGRVPNVDPQQVGTGGPGYTIQDEPVTAKYGRGVVAMARTSAPNSVGSQFFIVLDDQAIQALASYNTYQIIGAVTNGMDVVDAIGGMPNSGPPSNSAVDPIPMSKVTVTTP